MASERVLKFDIRAEVDRHFDESSVPRGEEPRVVIVMGGPAVGKTTFRKQQFPSGYVVVDAAEIFLSLSAGEFFDFPGPLERPMEIAGQLIAQRAVTERRHIVTELIGADGEATNALIEAMGAAGYRVAVQMLTCDVEVALKRNASRGNDDVSSYYAEPYHRRWLMEAASRSKPPPAV